MTNKPGFADHLLTIQTGPSAEGHSMDKLRDLANGQRRHIGMADARAINDLFEGLQFRLRAMVQFYDEHVGTPCARIRWAQEREEIAAKAREWAAHYSQSSDGQNTFVMFAEWVEARP